MLYEIAHDFPKDMIFKEEGPLVSLYQPTHRAFPDNRQDPIVFKNLVRDIENSLKKLPNQDLPDAMMKPLYALKDDKEFWNHTSEGIAVFCSRDRCVVFNLHTQVKQLAVVANSFHIKPLIKAHQSAENYQVLGLSRENFSLYQGNRYSLEEILIDRDAPRTMQDVLGTQLSDPYLAHGSHAGAGGQTMYHGHGDVKQEIDKDTEKYFRFVDSYVFENYSKKSKLPLLLVSLTEYHSDFHRICNNPYLLEEGIGKSIESMSLDEIQKQAHLVIEALNNEKMNKVVENFKKAEAEALASSDLVQVAKAAYENRIETILLEDEKIIPGKINGKTGEIMFCELESPECDDILDDLAELVISGGGKAFVLEKGAMPGTTGVAAIFRYH